jgi:GrpB-like predicted nucleotidyltransferase (UPF0157 family)
MIDPNESLKFVELVAHQPAWLKSFADAATAFKAILKDNCVAIHHIGSTAIPAIYAKPIVDMLPVVKNLEAVDALNSQFEALGYVCMGEYGIEGRRFFWKSVANRTHNVHLFEQGSPEISRHLAFRDFMLAHADYAQSYSLIKRTLAEVFPHDIESYVNGKSSFVQMIDYKTGTALPNQLTANDNIIIQPYNPGWKKLAAAEIKVIKTIAGNTPYVAIEHLGSTAVPELASKPIIDIFITVKSIEQALLWIKPLETMGYQFWDENPDQNHLRLFKGMPPAGKGRTHHIHITSADDSTVEHRILFRDILRRDEKIRQQYQELKLKLSQSDPHDRELYTNNKKEFISAVLKAHGYSKPIS